MTTITVPFYGQNLFVVDRYGEPFTPMKPIVTGMGLDWRSQFRKLTTNQRWGVVKMTIPPVDPNNQALCLPLRKLFGWLSTISPNKVKPELKDMVVKYQDECDNVLYKHWSRERSLEILGLTPAQQRHIQKRVGELAHIPGNSFKSVYGSIKDQFQVGTYKDVPAEKYPDLCRFLQCAPMEGELIEAERPGKAISLDPSEALKLHILMGHIKAATQDLQSLYTASRALESKPLLRVWDHLHEGKASYAGLQRSLGEALESNYLQQIG